MNSYLINIIVGIICFMIGYKAHWLFYKYGWIEIDR